MAATRLIALHVNKGKTVAQCLADRTDYSQNASKTNDGEFISSYECDPKTADEEFLLSKRQYQHITGRQQKNNIIAYQIRQSFKPGEITPEEANQVGYETAMRWTKGKHAFIVATHIDKAHIHNHIIYNSTSVDCSRKFNNFFLSGLAVQKLSDRVCAEHGLSIITPKPYRERQKRTVFPKKRTQRDELCEAIDSVLKEKPKSFENFVQALADMGFEYKDGKQPAFRGKEQKRFIRLRSLGEGYSEEELRAVISGKSLHKSKGGFREAPEQKQFHLLIDIQSKMAEGKSVGYDFEKARLIVREMIDLLVLDLVDKGLVTDQIVLTVGYDIENLSDPVRRKAYKGQITTDRYGRQVPKHAHGTANIGRYTSSTRLVTDAVLELYDRIVDKSLLVRRLNISVNHVICEADVPKENKVEQLDLFTDYAALEKEKEKEDAALEREKKMQQAVLTIKKKFGKNAILKGMNLQEGATAKDRNAQIGGHKA